MHCMKCGTKIEDQQSFCANCLEDMKKYPIKPNATVYLPPRTVAAPSKKKGRKNRDLKPEEQLRRSRRTVRYLTAALAAALIAFVLTALLLLRLIDQRDSSPGIGQNYGSMTDSGK